LASNQFSGAENVACQIISMFKDENIEFIYSSQDGQIRNALAERNIDFMPIERMSISEFKRVIQEVKPDAVHAHDMGASFYAALSCGRTPLVSHIHNNNFNSRRMSIKSILYSIAAHKATSIFWVSESSYKGYYFHEKFKSKSTILYNIIDANALYKKVELDNNIYTYDIVYLGRLTYPKNPQRIVDIVQKVVDVKDDIKIALIGTGDLESEIVQLIKTKNLYNNIILLGFQENPYKILHDARLMLMTSRWEGTPMCALEAMSMGVPIVTTPTDGLTALIKDGYNGILSDNDDELAQGVLSILKDDLLYNRLSSNQIARFEEINDLEKYKEKIRMAYGL